MPLTPDEIDFLGPTLAEYAELQVGPAWQCLQYCGIRFEDIVWLMEAYKYVDPPGIEIRVAGGVAVEFFRLGRSEVPLPECPWSDAEAVQRRNREMEVEVQVLRRSFTS